MEALMNQWQQANITFPDWNGAEQTALADLVPLLTAAKADGLISAWFFIRKRPVWRVRYCPVVSDDSTQAGIGQRFDRLAASGHLLGWTSSVYEPEVHAFGGTEAMDAAHRFFHRDSKHVLGYLASQGRAGPSHRRELSLLLSTLLMRAARQDWYEQGDIWARVAAHREQSPSTEPGDPRGNLIVAARRLLSADGDYQFGHDTPLTRFSGWADAYRAAGRELADLNASGHLRRGLRDVLAHHVIFAWNRLGLPSATQAILATAAKTVVFGPDPAQSESG
jgi:thiopeptide-type bacteriocin biosynthesis protein